MDCTSTQNCPFALKINDLEKDTQRNSDQHREFYGKFNDLEKKQAIVEERYNNILSVTNEIKTTVTELKDKPAKRQDTIVISIITTIIGLVLGFVFSAFIGG